MPQKYPKVEFDYAKALEIDQFNLALEWLAIPKQIIEVSEALAQAIFDRNKAKEKLEVIQAQLDAVVRSAAQEAQEKVTETVVKNRIITSHEYAEGQRSLNESDYVVDLLKSAVSAFHAKKLALENLVKLQGMKYYAEPYEPPETDGKIGPTAVEQGRRIATEKLREVMPSPEVEKPKPPVRPPARPLPRKS